MKKFVIIVVVLIFFSFNHIALAQERKDVGVGDIKCPEGSVCLDNPLGATTTVPALVGQIIKALLGISGSLALVMFIYGGFTWMTAAGNSEGIDKGKKIITWAVIGLIIIFSAYGLVRLVFTSLGVAV